jgi:hypothetical protein
MGTKNTSKYSTIQVGDRFEKWEVVGNVFVDRYAKVPCQCQCGVLCDVDAYTLIKGKSKSCKTCSLPRIGATNPAWKGYEEIPNSWFLRFKRYSKIEFALQIEDIWNLFLSQGKKCALTGLPISFANDRTRSQKYSGVSCTASIDRIDSKKGYTKDNIQLVHKDINIMKNQYNQDYFVEMCKAVTNHSK